VLKLKRDLLQGETVEGCDVVELFVLIEQVDLLIVRAKETKPNDFDNHGKRKATRERREILTRAVELVRQLTRTYQKLPCDPTDDAPPPPPPGTRACSDGVDNDADRLTDGPDPGCRTGAGFFQFFPFAPWDPDDRSEKDVSATISCATPQTRTLVNANSGATLIRHRLLGFAGAQLVAVERESTDGDFASGGPVPLATNGPSCSAPSPQDPTQLSASWSVSGTTVTWTVVSTGGGGGSAGLLAAANTR
jgi:hypothetical protein